MVLNTGLAKFRLLTCPQKSPPVVRRSCAEQVAQVAVRREIPFASVHVRV